VTDSSDPTATGADAGSEAFARAWLSYRRRWWLLLASGVGLVALAAVADSTFPEHEPGKVGVGLLVFLCGIPLVGAAGLGLAAWQCPRCRHDFFQAEDGWQNPWRPQCARCGLPKWSLDPNAGRPPRNPAIGPAGERQD